MMSEQDAEGFYDYVYRGLKYEIAAGERVFYVRTYDDEPGVAIVVHPTDARTSSEAKQLVEFLIDKLGCTKIKFYAPTAKYFSLSNDLFRHLLFTGIFFVRDFVCNGRRNSFQ